MPPKSKLIVNSSDEEKETGHLDNEEPLHLTSQSQYTVSSDPRKSELLKAVARKLDEPLTVGTFKSWFNSVQGLLDLQGLWDLLSKQLEEFKNAAQDEEPLASSSNGRSSEETDTLKLIWFFIYGSIKTREFRSAVDHIPKDQPGRLWSTLKELCGGLSEAQVQRWAKQFWNIKKLPNESVALFNGRFQNLVTDLAEAGRKVPEQDLQSKYLDALGSEYQALADSILLNTVTTNLNRIQGLAREYEIRNNRKKLEMKSERNDDNYGSALNTETYTKAKCHECKKLGHHQKGCTSSQSASGSTSLKCEHCGKTNHLSENCISYLKEQVKLLSMKSTLKGEANTLCSTAK